MLAYKTGGRGKTKICFTIGGDCSETERFRTSMGRRGFPGYGLARP
jgi:hypothetical protein